MTQETVRQRELIPEFPKVLTGETDPLYRTVKFVCQKMTNLKVSEHGQVLGLYGGRGTGKTSALLTLLSILRKQNLERRDKNKDDRKKTIEWLVPQSADDPDGSGNFTSQRQLFAPEFSRTGDDLLFMLLAYLEKWYPVQESFPRSTRPCKGTPLAKIQHAEVRRHQPKEFISFEANASVSAQELPRRLVRSQVQESRSTERMIGWFQELFDKLTKGETRLVLLIDDLDLQPHRALELLELIHLFVLQKKVIVVLAADEDLLIHNVAASLSKRNDGAVTPIHHRLARAMLQKWVPTVFHLPRPTVTERWSFPVLESTLGTCLVDDFWESAKERFGKEALARQAEDVLTPVLPDTYRGLVQLYNRLALIKTIPAETTPVEQNNGRWNLTQSMVAPFRSLLLCSGVSNPELGLPALAEDEVLEADFVQEPAVSASEPDSAEESTPTDERTQRPPIADSTSLSAQAPLLSEPLRTVSERERRRAQRHLAAVAKGWKTLSEAIQWHFLAISLNADRVAERTSNLEQSAVWAPCATSKSARLCHRRKSDTG